MTTTPPNTAAPDSAPSQRRPRIVLGLQPDVRQRFISDEVLAMLHECGEVVEGPTRPFDDWSAMRDDLLSADVLLLGWGSPTLDGVDLAEAPLRAVVHTGGSIKATVPKSLLESGVRVSSQTALNAEPVAEYTLAMIMLAAKDTLRAARLYGQRRGKVDWLQDFPDAGFHHARIGLVGLSQISRRVIELLKAFDVTILVYSRHLDAAEAERLGVTPASIEEIMSSCDVISLHSADVPANRHMINASHLGLIRAGATFINTARGGLVDQDALVDELRDGRFDAILDVAEPDVTVADSPLWEMDNVLLTPHFAGSVGRELHRLGAGAARNVAQFLAGEPMTGEITTDGYDGMA